MPANSVVFLSVYITRRWEKCATDLGNGTFKAYWDAIGRKWTIGWGSTGPDVTRDVIWTQAQCDDRHLSTVINLVEHVSRMVTNPKVTPPQMAALVSLAYNTGLDEIHDGVVTSFGIDSTLLRLVNSDQMAQAADEILKWCHARRADGTPYVVDGLFNRRKYERGVFLGEIVIEV